MVQVEKPQITVAKILPSRYVSQQQGLYLAYRPTNYYDSGSDLAGNTYWEFKETLNATRFRRIVKFDPKTHYADVQVSRKSLHRNLNIHPLNPKQN